MVVLAVGNPSRGDDALGPLLAERLEAVRPAGVEVIVDFQLQVEHALDLEGRRGVIFVDAARNLDTDYQLTPVGPARDASHSSHALSPAAVLDTFRRCTHREPPPAWILAVRGERFELGEALSAVAGASLESAWLRLRKIAEDGTVS